MLTIHDVIENCELAYEVHEHQPMAIKESAEQMLERYKPAPHSHTGKLLTSIIETNSPRIFLNAAKLRIRYAEETEFVEEAVDQ